MVLDVKSQKRDPAPQELTDIAELIADAAFLAHADELWEEISGNRPEPHSSVSVAPCRPAE